MLPLPTTMVPPSQRRPNAYRGGIIQIWLTRACDKSCFGCTQGSNLGGKPGMMTPEQFEEACLSLKDYWGVVGVFGGNPAVSPHFEACCEIMRRHIPYEQRGLWCNNLKGKGAAARATFNPAVCNLNVHMDAEALAEFRRDWPEAMPCGTDKDSLHAPPLVALQDVVPSEAERWHLIGKCDVNQNWSAMIGVFRGELRGYFCELAGAISMLHQHEPDYPDTGLPVTPGWWNQPMSAFEAQARRQCHECGIPLRAKGELAQGGQTEQVSATHAGVFKTKTPGRLVQIVTRRDELKGQVAKATDYLGNAGK